MASNWPGAGAFHSEAAAWNEHVELADEALIFRVSGCVSCNPRSLQTLIRFALVCHEDVQSPM